MGLNPENAYSGLLINRQNQTEVCDSGTQGAVPPLAPFPDCSDALCTRWHSTVLFPTPDVLVSPSPVLADHQAVPL